MSDQGEDGGEEVNAGSRGNTSKLGKSLLTAALTALFVGPITWFVKDYLSRDKLTIESALVSPQYDSFEVDYVDIEALKRAHPNGRRSEFDLWLDRQPD